MLVLGGRTWGFLGLLSRPGSLLNHNLIIVWYLFKRYFYWKKIANQTPQQQEKKLLMDCSPCLEQEVGVCSCISCGGWCCGIRRAWFNPVWGCWAAQNIKSSCAVHTRRDSGVSRTGAGLGVENIEIWATKRPLRWIFLPKSRLWSMWWLVLQNEHLWVLCLGVLIRWITRIC